mmetsp:Transcript_20931/g.62415  ORF Transcript_20931/g.62415 Transcript_20931/m.62415 type:complete len:227 (+) Transcript_20931:1133-1813(+)
MGRVRERLRRQGAQQRSDAAGHRQEELQGDLRPAGHWRRGAQHRRVLRGHRKDGRSGAVKGAAPGDQGQRASHEERDGAPRGGVHDPRRSGSEHARCQGGRSEVLHAQGFFVAQEEPESAVRLPRRGRRGDAGGDEQARGGGQDGGGVEGRVQTSDRTGDQGRERAEGQAAVRVAGPRHRHAERRSVQVAGDAVRAPHTGVLCKAQLLVSVQLDAAHDLARPSAGH